MTKAENAFFITVMVLIGIVMVMAIYTVTLEVKHSRDNISQSGDANIHFYVDPETKVEYVIYKSGYQGGICPRYNQDGTLYIWDARED